MSDVAGSLLGASIDGVNFRVAADSNVQLNATEFENDVVATSGRGLLKKTKRNMEASGLVLICSLDEVDKLRAIDESQSEHVLTLTLAGDDQYTAPGIVVFESFETEENRSNVKFIPLEPWTLIPS